VQLFTKEGIIKQLNMAVDAFEQTGRKLSDEQFFTKSDDLWSAAEQMQHLILAVKPLNKAFGLPRLVLRLLYGKPNRNSSINYQELVKKYQGKLERGAKASAAFTPKPITSDTDKESLINNFAKNYIDFTAKIASINEYDLDNYQLPHPILGKLSLREMLYFTAYHVEHHHNIVKERALEKVKNKR
jgi:DinB superfamily